MSIFPEPHSESQGNGSAASSTQRLVVEAEEVTHTMSSRLPKPKDTNDIQPLTRTGPTAHEYGRKEEEKSLNNHPASKNPSAKENSTFQIQQAINTVPGSIPLKSSSSAPSRTGTVKCSQVVSKDDGLSVNVPSTREARSSGVFVSVEDHKKEVEDHKKEVKQLASEKETYRRRSEIDLKHKVELEQENKEVERKRCMSLESNMKRLDELKQIQEESIKINKELKEAQCQKREFERQVSDLQDNLRIEQEEKRELKEENSELKEENKELQEENIELKQLNSNLSSQLTDERNARMKLEEQLSVDSSKLN